MSDCRLAMRCVSAGLITSLAGCLPLPHRHLDRPGVAFDVRDAAGGAVPGARLTVYTVRRPSNSLDAALTWARPARDARVALPAVRRRHAVMFLPTDAEAPNAWVWCATAPGHAAEVGELRAHDTHVRVALRRGAETLTCAPSDSGYRAVQRARARASGS